MFHQCSLSAVWKRPASISNLLKYHIDSFLKADRQGRMKGWHGSCQDTDARAIHKSEGDDSVARRCPGIRGKSVLHSSSQHPVVLSPSIPLPHLQTLHFHSKTGRDILKRRTTRTRIYETAAGAVASWVKNVTGQARFVTLTRQSYRRSPAPPRKLFHSS